MDWKMRIKTLFVCDALETKPQSCSTWTRSTWNLNIIINNNIWFNMCSLDQKHTYKNH